MGGTLDYTAPHFKRIFCPLLRWWINWSVPVHSWYIYPSMITMQVEVWPLYHIFSVLQLPLGYAVPRWWINWWAGRELPSTNTYKCWQRWVVCMIIQACVCIMYMLYSEQRVCVYTILHQVHVFCITSFATACVRSTTPSLLVPAAMAWHTCCYREESSPTLKWKGQMLLLLQGRRGVL